MFKASEIKPFFTVKAPAIPLGLWTGLAVWLSLVLVQPPLVIWILAFGPTVIVPLGLSLVERWTLVATERRWLKIGSLFVTPAAVVFVASLRLEQSWLAAMLAVPWLLLTMLLAMVGLVKLWRNGWTVNVHTAVAAALLFLPVGAGWAVLSRAGLRPQDFSHEIVLLTGVHFHYAGFALPLLVAAAVGRRSSKFKRSLIALVVVGVPAVGVGISFSPLFEVVAAVFLATACLALALIQAREAFGVGNANQAMLLLISSTSLVAAMLLAGVYAVGEFTELRWLGILAMIQTHGALNAFGFAFCGLIARVIGSEGETAT